MAEHWFRVHAALIDKPVIARAVDALGVSEHEAVGLMVTFWGALSQHVPSGLVAELPDRQLENWARWRGRRGRFAAFVRAQHIDQQGRVNEWDDYNGVLEDRRERDRERKRKLREERRNVRRTSAGQSAGQPMGRPHDVQGLRDDTIRDDTRTTSSTALPASSSSVSARDALAAQLPGPNERAALDRVLATAASAEACALALTAMRSGQDPAVPQLTPADFDAALVDFAGNGERWNARHFRGYLNRARPADVALQPKTSAGGAGSAGSAAGAVATNGSRQVASDPRGRAALVLQEIRDLVQSHQPPGQPVSRFIRRADVERLGTDVLAAYDAIGGAERVLGAVGEQVSFLARDFAAALAAAKDRQSREPREPRESREATEIADAVLPAQAQEAAHA